MDEFDIFNDEDIVKELRKAFFNRRASKCDFVKYLINSIDPEISKEDLIDKIQNADRMTM